MQQNKTASQRKTINPACWVPTAYFAMGLPFIAINLVSVFMFKDLGISDTQIAFWTSLIMMPWTLKFLWSPFLEMYRTKKFFVLITELLSGVLFGVVAFSLFFDYFFAISISTMAVIAFSGATHDIACDGVYMAELNKEDQAKYIGVQGAFYNVAKLVANGGLVAMAGALAEHFGAIEGASIDVNKGAYSSAWMIIFGVIAAIMVLIGIYHIKMLPSTQVPSTTKKTASEVGHELVAVIANFFTKKHILYYICFIILYRLAEGFIMKIAPLFLRASRDVGGLGLFTLCCIFNLPFVAYTFLAVAQPTNVYLIGTCITMEYFGYGFGFVGLTLFMMQQIAPGKHQMSHYAFASGIMNLGVMLPGMVSGYLSDLLGYRNFFIYVLIATIPAFLITYFIPFTYDDSKNK